MADATAAPGSPAAPHAPLRERLPRLSPLQAEVLRGLHARARHWTTPTGVLRLRSGRAPAVATIDGGVFELDADGTRLALQLASPPRADDDGLHWQDHRGRARVLAWSLMHETTLVQISEALGTSLLPLPDAPLEAPATDAIWLALDFTPADGSAALSGALRAPAAWLQAVLARTDAEPRPPIDPGHWRQLPTLATIALPAPALTRADIRGLRPGDVIVVGHVRMPPLHANAAGLRWPLRAAPDGWRIDGPPTPRPRHQETPRMSETDATEMPQTEDTPAVEDPSGRLPVEVEFEVGKVELRMSDIAGLQPGYVFALPTHLEGANVTIRANGQIAGQGELVAVGDTLGVRLLSWS
ncbi:type III secretion system cytoplasmic ring protein SctQ [Luteimonas sp. 3794]|uniref:type III secretion system cytoplasmic ring protein SctQ n=1 Tax=Luteimonas sp. 3794 TaxID=2817730 RepID=UPI00285AB3AB|nr:type III secretion system cytoplasmic ring protein SctQ [Luteimonas sp. 3794]MDR6993173.1 type III secretion protein Q [Luteimonas sp. 3794]